MKPSHAWLVWTALALCAITVFGAMTWLTRNVIAASRERATALYERALAESRADLEERTRLALWRMDALGAAIALRENRQPVTSYNATTASSEPEVLLHFQIRQGGGLTSPEADAQSGGQETTGRMKRLRALLAANPLPGDEWAQLNLAAESGETTWNAVPKDAPLEMASNKMQVETKTGGDNRRDATYQSYSNTSEYAQRAKAVAKNLDTALGAQQKAEPAAPQNGAPAPQDRAPSPQDVGQMRGVWLGGELFLLRQIGIEPTRMVQGVWLNAKALENMLLAEIPDLLPQAKLHPAVGEEVTRNPLALVSFPLLLDRNEAITAIAPPEKISISAPLRIGWAAVLLAVITTTLLVRGIMRLSERRASFVSAVTHELRTPLTTFRLYSDMLESGAVKPEKRGEYLRVLSREADRLSHLVENVLAFSRIERGNARSNVRDAEIESLLEEFRERLEARLATAGLTLQVDIPAPLRARVDTAAVEHILFNLIDNAAKYAATSDPPVVTLHARSTGNFVEILVTDHGPGIPLSETRRIFRAFHKSAHEAAESKPGVGLGLSLSRRLAKAMGGDLRCEPCDNGACFILSLPQA